MFDIPAGAVSEPIDVTVVPLTRDSSVAAFHVTTSDTRLLEPATISVSIPDGIEVPETAEGVLSLGARLIPFATVWDDEARTFTLTTSVLGFSTESLPLGPSRVGGLGSLVGSAELTLQELTCSVKISLLQEAIDGLAQWLVDNQLGGFAIEPIIQVESLLLNVRASCAAFEEDWVELNALALEEACSAWTRVEDQVTLFLPDTTWAATRKHFVQVAQAERLRQVTGATCGATPGDVLDAAASKYLEVLAIELEAPLQTAVPWTQQWGRFKSLLAEIPAELQIAGISEEAAVALNARVVPGYYRQLYESAVRRCGATWDHSPLGDVLLGGGVQGLSLGVGNETPPSISGLSLEEVGRSIQTCAGTFRAAVETDTEILDEQTLMGSGATLVSAALDIDVSAEPSLVFEGPMPELFCPLPQSDEELVIRGNVIVEGEYPTLVTLQPAAQGYLGAPLEIPWSTVVDRLDLAGETGETFRLVVERVGSCGGLWDVLDPEIFSIQYTVENNAPIDFEPVAWYKDTYALASGDEPVIQRDSASVMGTIDGNTSVMAEGSGFVPSVGGSYTSAASLEASWTAVSERSLAVITTSGTLSASAKQSRDSGYGGAYARGYVSTILGQAFSVGAPVTVTWTYAMTLDEGSTALDEGATTPVAHLTVLTEDFNSVADADDQENSLSLSLSVDLEPGTYGLRFDLNARAGNGSVDPQLTQGSWTSEVRITPR